MISLIVPGHAEPEQPREEIARHAPSGNGGGGRVSAPTEVIQFLIDAAYCVPSEAAYPNTSLEYRALYQSWRAALEAVGMTAEEARLLKDRDVAKGNGLTARGMKL